MDNFFFSIYTLTQAAGKRRSRWTNFYLGHLFCCLRAERERAELERGCIARNRYTHHYYTHH